MNALGLPISIDHREMLALRVICPRLSDDRDGATANQCGLLATRRLGFARQHLTAGPFLTLPVGR
jgi:hypothetical protein